MEPTNGEKLNKPMLDKLLAESEALVLEIELLKERSDYLAERVKAFKVLIDNLRTLEQSNPNENE